jgi:hypothetical protein
VGKVVVSFDVAVFSHPIERRKEKNMKRKTFLLQNLPLGLLIALIASLINIPLVWADPPIPPQWISQSSSGTPPAPRYSAGNAYDEQNDRFILFGGEIGGSPPRPADVWVLENASGFSGTPNWVELSPIGGPSAGTEGGSVVYDPVSNRAIIHGGCLGNCSPITDETWVLSNANGSGGTPEWTQLPSAAYIRTFHVGVYDPGSNRMMVYGGRSDAPSSADGNVWVLTDANGIGTPAWIELAPVGDIPPKRDVSASGTYDPSSNRLIIFGGYSTIGTYLHDVWVLSHANGLGGTPEWTQLLPSGTAPSPRGGHSMVYDPATNRMMVFGGYTAGSLATNEVWVLTHANGLGGTPEWIQLSPAEPHPEARFYHSIGYNTTTNRMIALMGRNDQLTPYLLSDIWVLTEANGLSSSTILSADSSSSDIYPGDPVSVDLTIFNAEDLYAAQAECTFDPSVLTAAGGTYGDFFDPVNRLEIPMTIDPVTGSWMGAISQANPAEPLSGTGLFATMEYAAQAAGTTAIDCVPLFSDRDGFELTVAYSGISITVLPFAQASGNVTYQGRLEHGGITVTATCTDVRTAITDINGDFTMALKAGECLLEARADCYLPVSTTRTVSSGDLVPLPSVVLKGGSVTGDDGIDIGDATLVAANFGLSVPPADPIADINGDGIVNIQDLAILGSNYGLSGTQPWE